MSRKLAVEFELGDGTPGPGWSPQRQLSLLLLATFSGWLGHLCRVWFDFPAPSLAGWRTGFANISGVAFVIAAVALGLRATYRLVPSQNELFRVWRRPDLRGVLTMEWIVVLGLIAIRILDQQGHVRSAALLGLPLTWVALQITRTLPRRAGFKNRKRIYESRLTRLLARIPGPWYRGVLWLNGPWPGYCISRYTTCILTTILVAELINAATALLSFF